MCFNNYNVSPPHLHCIILDNVLGNLQAGACRFSSSQQDKKMAEQEFLYHVFDGIIK